MQRISVFTVYL